MLIFTFEFQGITFELFGSKWNGKEALFAGDQEVSQKQNLTFAATHEFELSPWGNVSLAYKISPAKGLVEFHLSTLDEELTSGQYPLSPLLCAITANTPAENTAIDHATQPHRLETQPNNGQTTTANTAPLPRKRFSWIVLGGLALKLFKSIKVVKVALAGAALSSWAIFFSWEFACVLLGTIVFHEYGHLQAMKKFGIPTKGMYLIPFVGGVAIGERAKTRWQDVYISMMGPVFGLFMSVAFYIAYLLTGSHFCGLVATTSALINVFNLLPIHPLDGGQVVKALVFSGRTRWAILLMLLISAAGFALAVKIGLIFICFFIVIGVMDILSDWKQSYSQDKTPMSRYGIAFSLAWYLGVVAIFLALIITIANSGLPGSEVILRILQS